MAVWGGGKGGGVEQRPTLLVIEPKNARRKMQAEPTSTNIYVGD